MECRDMKALTIDLRSPSRPPRRAWGAVVSIGLVALGLAVVAAWQVRKLEALKTERDALLRAAASPIVVERPAPRKMPYDASAREILALATSEWPAMLAAVESVELVGVTPVALEIAPAERRLRVDVEFADYAVLLQYVDALNAGEPKPRWALVQAQSTISTAGPSNGRSSTATVRASW
jgi:hypothetical protein